MDQIEWERRKGIIGIGAVCSLCDKIIRSGESYLSGWSANQDKSIHDLYNR